MALIIKFYLKKYILVLIGPEKNSLGLLLNDC
jgi:hypothetical protein